MEALSQQTATESQLVAAVRIALRNSTNQYVRLVSVLDASDGVTLIGLVSTHAEKLLAQTISFSIVAPYRVHNQIHVVPIREKMPQG